MAIPTEPIGSIPRPRELLVGLQQAAEGAISEAELDALFDQAVRSTITELEATGSPVITDGEQCKPSFATYPVAGLETLASDGVVIPFADGHTRQLPALTAGPFRYRTHADSYLVAAQRVATRPVKQAVISASALSLLYPSDGIDGYSREAFLADLVDEAEADIRGCLEAGAYNVQIDFTEARLSLKLDPSGGLLRNFIDLNNQVLDRFSAEERRSRIGVHSCPGGDHDSTHSADVDYAALLPLLFELHAGAFYLELAGEADPEAVLETVAANLQAGPACVRGRHRSDRPRRGDGGAGSRPCPSGGQAHSPLSTRNDRRLRLLAVCRRRLDCTRDGLREDPRPDSGHGARFRASRRLNRLDNGLLRRRRRRAAGSATSSGALTTTGLRSICFVSGSSSFVTPCSGNLRAVTSRRVSNELTAWLNAPTAVSRPRPTFAKWPAKTPRRSYSSRPSFGDLARALGDRLLLPAVGDRAQQPDQRRR